MWKFNYVGIPAAIPYWDALVLLLVQAIGLVNPLRHGHEGCARIYIRVYYVRVEDTTESMHGIAIYTLITFFLANCFFSLAVV